MKKILIGILAIMIMFTGCGESREKAVDSMKIKISVGGKIFNATLEDNPTTQELLKNFPLEVKMTELNGNEKYYKFSKNFPSNDKKVGKISTGDIMLYSSSYLVIFYKDFPTNYSYTRLGKIENFSELAKILGNENIVVKFEE